MDIADDHDDELPSFNDMFDDNHKSTNDALEDEIVSNDDNKNKNVDDDKQKSAIKRNMRPQPKLDYERLISNRGLSTLSKRIKTLQFKGKGYEASDLQSVIMELEHWAHRLFPKYTFTDFLARMEKLGTKREIKHAVKQVRNNLENKTDEEILCENSDKSDNDDYEEKMVENISDDDSIDNSDKLFIGSDGDAEKQFETSKLPELTDEQKAKIEENKQKALERLRQKRLQVFDK